MRFGKIKVLIIYYHDSLEIQARNTILEHLYSFKHYSHEKCFYINVKHPVPNYLFDCDFDLIIFHYTFFAMKWGTARWNSFVQKCEKLKKLYGYKTAIVQDEYIASDKLNAFFRDFGIKTVFTLLPESEWQKVYPREESGLEHCIRILPGYIDEFTLKKIKPFVKAMDAREYDVGYRARKVPYFLGRHGQLKFEIVEKFRNAQIKHNLKMDLTNDISYVFYGLDWYKFIASCRVVLGCEGGASLHDPGGSIKEGEFEYMREHPEAGFEEVEKAVFPGKDGNLNYFVPSPRNFDAAITKTAQALIEGDYAGIFKPGVHYIEIKKDWSNIEDVIRKIEDVEYCEKLANNTYRDIVESGLYTYRKMVEVVINHAKKHRRKEKDIGKDNRFYEKLLVLREEMPFLFFPIYTIRSLVYNLGLRVTKKIVLSVFSKAQVAFIKKKLGRQ